MRVKAARLLEHGQPLRIEEADLAEPGEREVIVDVAYAGVNPVDMYAAPGTGRGGRAGPADHGH